MPDITMCANGSDCPKHKTCYRFRAIPTPGRQSFAPYYHPGEKCESYWEIEPGHRLRALTPAAREAGAEAETPGRREKDIP